MLIADLSPQEVCVYLKLCDDKPVKDVRPWAHITGIGEFDSEERKYIFLLVFFYSINFFFSHLF